MAVSFGFQGRGTGPVGAAGTVLSEHRGLGPGGPGGGAGVQWLCPLLRGLEQCVRFPTDQIEAVAPLDSDFQSPRQADVVECEQRTSVPGCARAAVTLMAG